MQECFLLYLLPLRFLENPKDGPDRYEAVDVRGPVEWIEGHDVVATGRGRKQGRRRSGPSAVSYATCPCYLLSASTSMANSFSSVTRRQQT